MKQMQGIKTVFVDIDDTLWWFTENSKLAFRHVFEAFKLSRLCDYERFHGVYLAKNNELWHLYHHGLVEREFLMYERFRHTLEQCGYRGDCLELGNRINDEYLDSLATMSCLVPGARELLEYLVAQGYDVNTLSNGFAGVQQRKLRSAGIDHLIHHNVLSDDCGITKPMPGIFAYALARCGALAENTVMIGDDPDADIAGAHAAGWRTIYFNMKNRAIAPGIATHEVKSLLDVKGIL